MVEAAHVTSGPNWITWVVAAACLLFIGFLVYIVRTQGAVDALFASKASALAASAGLVVGEVAGAPRPALSKIAVAGLYGNRVTWVQWSDGWPRAGVPPRCSVSIFVGDGPVLRLPWVRANLAWFTMVPRRLRSFDFGDVHMGAAGSTGDAKVDGCFATRILVGIARGTFLTVAGPVLLSSELRERILSAMLPFGVAFDGLWMTVYTEGWDVDPQKLNSVMLLCEAFVNERAAPVAVFSDARTRQERNESA